MIRAFRFIGSVGCFDTFQGSPATQLAPLTLVYAENGRGKTTITAILRSLATNDPRWIKGRRRIGAHHAPHVVIDVDGAARSLVFQNGAWNATHDSILIFDDYFVDDNVCSGLSIDADHRQNLHEVILGSQGVALKHRVDELTETIAKLNQELRDEQAAVPKDKFFGLDVDQFCDLPPLDNVETKIQELEKQLEAVRQSDRVRTTRFFSRISFPAVDVEALEKLLARQLSDLDQDAVAHVQGHLALLGEAAERWVSDGVQRIIVPTPPDTDAKCPFCGQSVTGIALVDQYRAYFGKTYRELQAAVQEAISHYQNAMGGDALANCQREIGRIRDQYDFWRTLTTIPDFQVDFDALSAAWKSVRDAVVEVLGQKKSAILDARSLTHDVRNAIELFQQTSARIGDQIESLVASNDVLTSLKESTAASDAKSLSEELQRARAAKERHSPEVAPLCNAYEAARAAKKQAEKEKKQAREALDQHRLHAFPAYKARVNHYLQRFGAGFRLGDVQPLDKAGRASTTYHLVIQEVNVPLVEKDNADAAPSFKTALSAGDRSTLALSFFFASADLDGGLAGKIVIIDDPVTSLDDGRMANTVSEVLRLRGTTRQLIVLSHAKPFLCRIHKHADSSQTACLVIQRSAGNSSILAAWEPTEDEFTQYDHRHRLLREFRDGTAPNIRQVAESLRPIMEGYLRVAFPKQCPPGTLLGPLRNHLSNLVAAGAPVIAAGRLKELAEITEYANKFHHDTNPAWETEHISDAELLGFVNRVLSFVSY